MNKEKKVMIIALTALLIIVIGASYAFFTAGISSEDSTTIKADAGTMKINYDGGSNITLSGIYPKDEEWATKVITVTGNNTTDAKMYYKLTLVVDSNTFLTSDPLQYELTSTNTSTNGETITAVSKTNLTGTTIELGKGYFNKANNARHTYQLKIYYPKTTSDQNVNQGKEFSAHVEISSVKEDKLTVFATAILTNNEVKIPITTPGVEVSAHTINDLDNEIIFDLGNESLMEYISDSDYFVYGTGWEANGTNFNLTGVSTTSGKTLGNDTYEELVGKFLPYYFLGDFDDNINEAVTDSEAVYYVVSVDSSGALPKITCKLIGSNKNTTEAILASAEDDYGTSYYFRGSVKNNYVEFANKCWRIVRIGGDNTVKLILHNDNTTNASNPCSSANNSDTAAFAHYDGDTYTSIYSGGRDNAYVGFMYGTPAHQHTKPLMQIQIKAQY